MTIRGGKPTEEDMTAGVREREGEEKKIEPS